MDIIRDYIIYHHAEAGSIPKSANPVGGQVEAGETTGYINRTEGPAATIARAEEATVPSAVNRAA